MIAENSLWLIIESETQNMYDVISLQRRVRYENE